MLSREELADLYAELREVDVLSVYVHGGDTDPAERRAWIRELERRMDGERSRVELEAPAGAGPIRRGP